MAKQLNKSGKTDHPKGKSAERQVKGAHAKKSYGSAEKVPADYRGTASELSSSRRLEMTEPELKDLIRVVVREELSRLQSQNVDLTAQTAADDRPIDRLAEDIFDKYDDVFKALA